MYTTREYPSDPLRRISALQTYVDLAGNLSSGCNLAGKFAYRRIDSWEIYFACTNSLHIGFLNQIWLENTLKWNYCELTEACNLIRLIWLLRSFLLEKNACNLKTGSFGYLLKVHLSANNGCLFCCQWTCTLPSTPLLPTVSCNCSFNRWSGLGKAPSYRTTGYLEISKRYLILVIRLITVCYSVAEKLHRIVQLVRIHFCCRGRGKAASFHDWLSENLETPLFGTCSLFTFCYLLAEAVLYRSHLLVKHCSGLLYSSIFCVCPNEARSERDLSNVGVVGCQRHQDFIHWFKG